LVGGGCRLLMAELDELILEEFVEVFAVLASDGVCGMVGIGQGQIG
jgi:hypothetical protein